jgi:putative SOS response-associated peptidase YedK
MCGRFVAPRDPAQLREVFNPQAMPSQLLSSNYNVSPTQEIYAVVAGRSGQCDLIILNWGISASWDPKRKLANARSESVANKNSFKEMYFKNRCLVPMQGYYEWFRPIEKTEPIQPYFIFSRKLPLLPVAGIYKDGELTILTRAANQKLSKIHDRMPVLVAPKNWEAWLNGQYERADEIEQLIPQVPEDLLNAYQVGSAVNNSRSQGADLIKPIAAEI